MSALRSSRGARSGAMQKVVPIRGRGGEAREPASPASLAALGVWITLAPIALLFLSFASAFVVRRGLGQDWVPVSLPALVWVNTAVLLLSSAALEAGRRAHRRGAGDAAWVWVAFALGCGFFAGQVAAWLQLQARGVSVGATPYGSFFYVLTGAHAAHLAGGIVGLLLAAVWPREGWRKLSRAGALRASAIYWHFMDALWVGILLLLVLGR